MTKTISSHPFEQNNFNENYEHLQVQLDGSRITRATGLKRPRRAAAQVCRRNIGGSPLVMGVAQACWMVYGLLTLFHGKSEHKMDDNCKAIFGNLHLPSGRWSHWKIRGFQWQRLGFHWLTAVLFLSWNGLDTQLSPRCVKGDDWPTFFLERWHL